MRGRFSYLTRPDKACQLSPHPPQCAHWGTCPYPLCPFGTTSLPLLAFGHFPLTGGISPLTRGVGPLWGGRLLGCSNRGGIGPFVGRLDTYIGNCGGVRLLGAGGPVCRSYGAPIHTGRDSAPSSAPFGGTFPPRGRFMERTLCAPTAYLQTPLHTRKGTGLGPVPSNTEAKRKLRIKFLCLLSFSKKVSYSRMAPRSAEDTILA